MEKFNPSNSIFTKVEDLPTEEQKKFKDIGGGFVQKSAIEDIESAHDIANTEKKERELAEINKEILEKIRKLDLSSPNGQIEFNNIIEHLYNISFPMLTDEHQKPLFPFKSRFFYNDLLVLTRVAKYFDSALPIKEDNLIKNYPGWMHVFGHELIKHSSILLRIFLGQEYSVNNQEDFETKNSIAKFIYTISVPYNLAADTPNNTFNGRLLAVFEQMHLHENIPLDEIKKHPNYAKGEELMIKASNMVIVIRDIIYKILSEYVHTSNFNLPDIFSELDEDKIIEIIKTIKRCQEYHNNLLRGEKRKAWNKYMEIEEEAVKSFEFDEVIDREQKDMIQFIDYFQPIIERINNKMHFYSISKE